MSDPAGAGEPAAYGSVHTSVNMGLPGVPETTQQVSSLNQALQSLQQTLKAFASASSGFTTAIGNVTKSLQSMSGSAGGISSSSAPANGGFLAGASSLVSAAFGTADTGLVRDIALFPARFINSQITNNRNLVNSAGMALGQQSFATGANLQDIITKLAGFGKEGTTVMSGNPSELLNMMNIAGKVGAGIDWSGGTTKVPGKFNAPRAGGFMESMRQAQLMNPGADLGQLAGTIGGYLANTGAQQQGAFLTGGAFSMIGSKGRAKSISEWAEGILKWFMNQRPGNKRNTPFTYGDLMSQNFPGSNMDAWFTANGVPANMSEQFWSYALGKASTTDTTGGDAILQRGMANIPTTTQQNPVYQRLAAGNAASRAGFNLGGKLTGMYGNMEQANRSFNTMLGSMVNATVPTAVASGPLSWLQYVPDEIRNLLMSFAERTNVGALGAGVLGWGSLFTGALDQNGDVGDIGGYGSLGTAGTAGMHPDMRKRVNAMMRANPNLSITSGHRDLAKQQMLKRNGVGRVSGRPSAHTRGMAADMGPASQYGWLVANAGKFGLSSGVGAGEPWHVGLGDITVGSGVGGGSSGSIGGATSTPTSLGGVISDLADPSGLLKWISGMFGGFSGAFAGGNQSPDDQMKGISGGIATVLKNLLSMFASSPQSTDSSRIAFNSGLYDSMAKATANALNAGLPTGTSTGTSGLSNTPSPFAAPAGTVAAAASAAQAAYAAGFRGDDLFKILSIGGRESHWNARAINPNTSDRGLFQMNWSAWKSDLIKNRIAFTQEDLLDPYKNAQAAWYAFHTRGNDSWKPWKASPIGWDPKGDELYGTTSYQPIARTALAQQFPGGYGDVDGSGYAYTVPGSGSRSVPMVMYNSFTIGTSGTGGGGVDTRKVASQVADHLEQQMRQRMARNN